MNTINFQNRQSLHPRRKKLTIVNQTADTMLVDVENADEPTQEGTPINATTMSALQQEIVDLESLLNTRLNKKLVCGVYQLANSESTFIIETGLTTVTSIVLTLTLNTTAAACRTVMVKSISGGNVTCNIRNTYNGGIESINNATSVGFAVNWIAIGE